MAKSKQTTSKPNSDTLLVLIAIVLAVVGLKMASTGVGRGHMLQDDGYNVTGAVITLIAGLIAGHDVPEAALGGNCTLNLPGLSVSVGDMLAALEAVAGAETARRVTFAPDAAVERIVRSWPAAWDCARAQALGLSADADFAAIIQAYREDDMASPGAQRSTPPSAQT